MPQGTITAVSPDVREWSNDQGTYKSFKLKFEGQGDKVFEINRKHAPDKPAQTPQVGESFEYEVKGTKEFGGQTLIQIKRVSSGGRPGGGGGRPAQDERWVTLRHAQKLAADIVLATV